MMSNMRGGTPFSPVSQPPQYKMGIMSTPSVQLQTASVGEKRTHHNCGVEGSSILTPNVSNLANVIGLLLYVILFLYCICGLPLT